MIGALVSFAVSLFVGGLAIYVGGRIVSDTDDYGRAVVTALLGAIVWAIAAILAGWVPLVGWLLPLVAWIWLIKRRYPGGWRDAILIGAIAWIAALLIVSVLPYGAVGVPGA